MKKILLLLISMFCVSCREEAAYIAWNAGQITNDKAFMGGYLADDNPNNHVQIKEDGSIIIYNFRPLFSEDLY